MNWTPQAINVHGELESFIEAHQDVLGPHKHVEDDDPTIEMEAGTWVVTGFALVVEWQLLENTDEVGVSGSEYLRFFPSKRITESHAAGLLHTALFDMD